MTWKIESNAWFFTFPWGKIDHQCIRKIAWCVHASKKGCSTSYRNQRTMMSAFNVWSMLYWTWFLQIFCAEFWPLSMQFEQISGKDGAKPQAKLRTLSANLEQSPASRLAVYNTYIPQTGNESFALVHWGKIEDLLEVCSKFAKNLRGLLALLITNDKIRNTSKIF